VNDKSERIIKNRAGAILAVVLTGWNAVSTIHALFSHSLLFHEWILPFHWHSSKLNLCANGAWYAFQLYACFWLFRLTRGKERILALGWILMILVTPIQQLLPEYGWVAVQFVKAVAMIISLGAAILVLLEMQVARIANARIENKA
jgi:hypothetical protein